jgi:hypothetical protein
MLNLTGLECSKGLSKISTSHTSQIILSKRYIRSIHDAAGGVFGKNATELFRKPEICLLERVYAKNGDVLQLLDRQETFRLESVHSKKRNVLEDFNRQERLGLENMLVHIESALQ